MKKSIILLGLMSIALALTNCAVNDEQTITPNTKGENFAIYLSPATRTAATGTATAWESGDAINLFHAETGTTAYVNNGSFAIAAADIDAGKFTGTLGGDFPPTLMIGTLSIRKAIV